MTEHKQPATIVIFGASGDLTRRKLIPALFRLCRQNLLPAPFQVVGFAVTEWDTAEFRRQMRGGVDEFAREPFSEAEWQTFAERLHYTPGGFTEAADFAHLRQFLEATEGELSHRLYYLATPPRFFADIIAQLGAAGMAQDVYCETGSMAHVPGSAPGQTAWRRVIIEKPFGRDLASAQALNQAVHAVLAEHQIYRIDHYLAKETVQNILVFRFANTMFEPIWNRNYIDHVQITVAEAVDVGHRAGYYDQAGVLRDMFQNHLMQLLALVGMEPPASFDANAIRDEKVKTMRAVRPLTPTELANQTVRAQYEGYGATAGVVANSQTPTYAALELYIDNWRWQGVPFYLRSGKALAQKTSEIIIQFKRPPHIMFPVSLDGPLRSNYLALCIQPHEGFHQRFEVKVPGREIAMRPVDMDFHYDDAFVPDSVPEAYETLLLNALEGDATLFTRSDGIEAAWRVIDSVLQGWETDDAPPLTTYRPGSWGPAAADELLGRNGRFWRHGCLDT
ncbi:MAG: glucose-6-phosphate dehydrogenase [Chloroflexi bacterium]|nr:glucose-6-phosphate dehydrogenase [Ardenticatenaceae bacterium]MBL1129418.1 glucose-6-phosphate dehydrogenase [Chloroflexota bacterium]NOG35498.1 glucose-6-phosphate dehydrogenase [Chloroflexota bacterium]GIK57447.1 MAG: glucose-6-phosphate 1-dehydrogenase [Chloroflexota bacterium]